MPEPAVLLTVADGIGHVELNRPDTRNAADLELTHDLEQALRRAGDDPDVAVVLLSGRGKAFSVGGDLSAMHAATDLPATIGGIAEASHGALRAMDALDKPIVAVVHGSAAGAGLGYACASDLVLAGESAKFVSAFIAIGITPDSGTSWHLPRLVGLRRALELTLTNRVLTAAEAQEWGIVTAVHPDDEVHEAGRALAASLAGSGAAGGTRRLVRASGNRTLDEQLDAEAASVVARAATPEVPERVRAFVERKKPS